MEGLTLAAAAEAAGEPLPGFILNLLARTGLQVGCIVGESSANSDEDMRQILRDRRHMAGSDGIQVGSHPHPRGWGTFPRLLGHHTRDLGDWTWGQAAHHMSGAAARRFRLSQRGEIRNGYWADLVIIDPTSIADGADYDHPRREPSGVRHVFVNGVHVKGPGAARTNPGKALRSTR